MAEGVDVAAKRLRTPVIGQGLLLLLLLQSCCIGCSAASVSNRFDHSTEEENFNRDEADWSLARSLVDRLKASSEALEDDNEDTELEVEATKRSWIAELAANAEKTEATADLIEEIQARTSSSGLRSLKAACKAMCPKCVCGVILMPSLPLATHPKKPVKLAVKPPKKPVKLAVKPPKKPFKLAVKPLKKPFKLAVKPLKKPVKLAVKPPKKPVKLAVKPPAKRTESTKPKGAKKASKVSTSPPPPPPPPPPSPPAKEAVKKAKKWLHLSSLESQLPDFLLDEDGDDSVFKREVDDHDPLSTEPGNALNNFGIE